MKQVTTDVYNPQLNMTPITPEMGRDGIYELLEERILFISKRECTLRVMDESGVNTLLDQLCVIQEIELETEINYLQEQYSGKPRIV